MSAYFEQLCAAMGMLAKQPGAVFLGQGVLYSSTNMSPTFCEVPEEQRLEMPVAEELQAGMALGMALQGFLPVCVFPRWNFVLRAADQIVNHIDRLPIYSASGYRPRVIIRTAVPSAHPFNPQAQHDGDFSTAFKYMLRTIAVVVLETAEEIMPAYERAMTHPFPTILVEYADKYRAESGAKR